MNADRRKALKAQFKARKVIGGIYRVVNRETGRYYLDNTDDMQSAHNWFGMCQTTGICNHPHLQEDWLACGKDAFQVEELDWLEKGEDQSLQDFQKDLKALYELWDEKLGRENRY